MSQCTAGSSGWLPVTQTAHRTNGGADLAAAHAEISSLSPFAVAELILALTVDVRRLSDQDVSRVRLAAIRLAYELRAVAA